jgi:hypothetical protein
MSPLTIEVVEKRTFLEFAEVGEDAEAEGDHRLLMCRAKTEPFRLNKVAASRAEVVLQVPTSVHSCSAESTPKSSISTAATATLWSDVTDDDEKTDLSSTSGRPSVDSHTPPPKNETDPRTTLMLRNLPNDYNRQMFMDMLDGQCLAGEYDFLYFPVDFETGSGLGYAFVNFTSHVEALRAWELLDGYRDWFVPSTKVCEVRWSTPVQGFNANVQRYRNSPLMHPRVPDSYKPVVFSRGARIEYPAPKKPIKYMPGKRVANNRK